MSGGPPPTERKYGDECVSDTNSARTEEDCTTQSRAESARGQPAEVPMLMIIRLYQVFLSRWTPECPQEECCSDYAIRMVGKYGPRKGLDLAAKRVKECG